VIYLSEQEQEKKKKKKQKKLAIVLETEVESELEELVEILEELEKEKKYVDIQVCPHCKSPKVRRVKSTEGDVLAHMGLTPPKYECKKCGWREKLVVKATNKPTTVKDVVLMAEANEAEKEKYKPMR
jgi:transposase-like protein